MTSSMYSAQTDRFVHDRLPPPAQLPTPLPGRAIADPANLVDVLFSRAIHNGHADRPMLRSDKLTLSYADALAQVNQIAQVLTEDFALVPGNRVLLRGGNSIGMALAWLGVVQAGLVAVASMPLLRAKELGEMIDKAQPSLALCDASLLEELQTAQSKSKTLQTIVPFNVTSKPGALADLCAKKDGQFTPCPTATYWPPARPGPTMFSRPRRRTS